MHATNPMYDGQIEYNRSQGFIRIAQRFVIT